MSYQRCCIQNCQNPASPHCSSLNTRDSRQKEKWLSLVNAPKSTIRMHQDGSRVCTKHLNMRKRLHDGGKSTTIPSMSQKSSQDGRGHSSILHIGDDNLPPKGPVALLRFCTHCSYKNFDSQKMKKHLTERHPLLEGAALDKAVVSKRWKWYTGTDIPIIMKGGIFVKIVSTISRSKEFVTNLLITSKRSSSAVEAKMILLCQRKTWFQLKLI